MQRLNEFQLKAMNIINGDEKDVLPYSGGEEDFNFSFDTGEFTVTKSYHTGQDKIKESDFKGDYGFNSQEHLDILMDVVRKNREISPIKILKAMLVLAEDISKLKKEKDACVLGRALLDKFQIRDYRDYKGCHGEVDLKLEFLIMKAAHELIYTKMRKEQYSREASGTLTGTASASYSPSASKRKIGEAAVDQDYDRTWTYS